MHVAKGKYVSYIWCLVVRATVYSFSTQFVQLTVILTERYEAESQAITSPSSQSSSCASSCSSRTQPTFVSLR
eukprot:1066095-Alexandrium_andersonii.AAC.1